MEMHSSCRVSTKFRYFTECASKTGAIIGRFEACNITNKTILKIVCKDLFKLYPELFSGKTLN